ncbi:MAG: IS21 family transposase [Solirubrobacteraceae bacterium]
MGASRVEQFEQIRRDRAQGGMSIRELAKRHGVHRRAVRQALESAVPPPKRQPRSRPAPKLGPYRAIVDEWLEADQKAPRKQRHTARRIHQRLVAEHGAAVSERQVDRYVAAKRREVGEVEACVPLVSEAGVEAEVDWGEAQVIVRGCPVVVHLFLMRACHSGASFVVAFHSETQQAFLEGHVAALEFFGGVFGLIRYDNLKAAVTKVLKGRRRVESDRFVALRSHYGFDSSFCLSGQQGAHEKGGVEGEVGRFRRRHLVPVPKVDSLGELNERLEAACWDGLRRTIVGRPEPVGEMLARERALLADLPAEPHCTAEEASPRVDSKALATVRQNRYSVPARLVGMRVRAQVGARQIAIWHDGAIVATHERLPGRHEASAQLEHYLDLLTRKPGALARSLALRQQRDRGDWPPCFDRLWGEIEAKAGRSEAARQIVEVLLLCREHGAPKVELAVRGALAAGAYDGRAVALLARRGERPVAPTLELEDRLAGVGSPPPTDLSRYDRLREAV